MSAPTSEKRVRVIQGEYRVSDDPDVVLTTILGSCVAACLRDPHARVGGMNHFLLPGRADCPSAQEAERYGVHLMELLVNGLLQRGAKRQRLEAKLFGGARIVKPKFLLLSCTRCWSDSPILGSAFSVTGHAWGRGREA